MLSLSFLLFFFLQWMGFNTLQAFTVQIMSIGNKHLLSVYGWFLMMVLACVTHIEICPLIYHFHARLQNRKDSWLRLTVLGLFHKLFWFELQFTVRFECLDVKLSSLWAAALPHTLWQCKLGTCLCLTGSWNVRISILRKAKYSVRRTYCIATPIA